MAKIFISHSSKDKEVIDLFKNKILNSGLGILDEDIAYTSAVETGVEIGTSIPNYINERIKSCDVVFFMISESYKRSEICLNEMGAAWALDKHIIPLLIGDIGFESIGWLFSHNLGAKIDDDEQLDGLRDAFVERYGSATKTIVWNRCKREFIGDVANSFTSEPSLLPAVIEDEEVAEELGVLDYEDMLRGVQDNLLNNLMAKSKSIKELTENIEKRTSQLFAVNSKSDTKANRSHKRAIYAGLAKEFDSVSNSIDQSIDFLFEDYESVVEYCLKVKELTPPNGEVRTRTIDSVTYFMSVTSEAKDSNQKFIDSIESLPKMEKTFIASKKRLAGCLVKYSRFLDTCLDEAPKLLK